VDASPYFAPTYFAASFFAPLVEVVPAVPIAPTSGGAYFAPSYFAPSFFASGGTPAPVVAPTSTGAYFAPTYFAPTYFAVLAWSPVPVTPPVVHEPPDGVQAAFGSLVSLLQGTGAFEDVIFGDPSRRGQAGAGRHPLALVSPRGWEDSDDYDPTSIVRRVSFAVRVVVRADDVAEPYDQLYRLASTVEGVVNRADLGGPCLPALTRIRAGRHDHAVHYPELALELEGEFSMLLDLEVPPSAPA